MKKIKKTYGILAGFAVLVLAAGLTRKEEGIPPLIRPSPGENEKKVSVYAYIEQESEPIPVTVTLEPKAYNAQEAAEAFEAAYEVLLEKLPGANQSLEKVCGDLDFIYSLEEYGMDIFWTSEKEELIDAQGRVYPYRLREGTQEEVVVTAVLVYEQYRAEYNFTVTVVYPESGGTEEKTRWLQARLAEALEEQKEDIQISLPQAIEGKEIHYEAIQDNSVGRIWTFIVLAVLAVWLGGKAQETLEVKKRRQQMEADYCEVVSKLTLLMGAGLTIRGAWEKVTADYSRQRLVTGKRAVYEEMEKTLFELASGVPERLVYENFGKRCALGIYLKLGTLLEQNLLKGSKHLLKLLEEESDRAFEERKNIARKQGERAGTRLLIPMGMELIAVMAIVIIPAVMTF